MYEELDNIWPYIIVAVGSIIGAISRIKITYLFHINNSSNIRAIVTVNTVSIFLLGFFLALQNGTSINNNNSLYLLLCIGFLGSFSTFSAFISELYIFLQQQKWLDFMFYSIISIIFGLTFASLGYLLGNG